MANSLTATRQAREREVLPKLYNMLSRDHAVKTTADNVANRVGIISKPQMVTFAGKLEELGIIGREYRLDGQGKASYWKLLVPFKTAEAKLESSHREELQPITKNSLKARILRAIEEKGKFDNTIDLINYIKGERKAAPDPHEVTHILHSLKRAGYIRFRRSNHPEFNGNGARKGKDIVPVNIVLQRRAAKATAMVEPVEAVIDDPEPGAIVAPIMVIPDTYSKAQSFQAVEDQ